MTWREHIPYNVQGLLEYAELAGVEGWTELVNRMAKMLDSSHKEYPWDRDIVDELARNDNCPGLLENGWWLRSWSQIDYVTIHHTYGWNSPHAFADWYINKDGGRPSTCYSVWITETGEILLCNLLIEGCWHDHTGHENTHLSIGMAGALHTYAPCDAQLDATARVCKWVIESEELPLINSIKYITGHVDWTGTACPGWLDTGEGEPSGLWKPLFYDKLINML